MKHIIAHSNEVVSVHIEIEAPSLTQRVREIIIQAEAMIDHARGAIQTDCTLRLLSQGPRKIQVIRVIREHTQVGLKEAKDIVDRVEQFKIPVTLMTGERDALTSYEADLREVGAEVVILTPDESIVHGIMSQ